MQTTGRLALIALFAAAGAGLAVWVGMSTSVPEPPPKRAPASPVALLQTRDEAALAPSSPAKANLREEALIEAPQPGSSTLFEPDLFHAQQAVLSSGNSTLPFVPAAPPAAPAPPLPVPALATPAPARTPAVAPVGKTILDDEGDGKSRVPIRDDDKGKDRVAIRVYRTNYITAAELKALIAPLLTEKTGAVSVSRRDDTAVASNNAPTGSAQLPANEVLVVRDYEAVLTQIDQMVAEVDVHPLQVLIEAVVLTVKLRDKDNRGVDFPLLSQNPHVKFDLGSPAAAMADVPLGGSLKFGFLDGNFDAFLDALEQTGHTEVIADVIANARLMVLNRQRAKTQIGVRRGCVNRMIAETSSLKSDEFLDVGAQLRLQPYMFGDGLIHVEVQPDLLDRDLTADAAAPPCPTGRSRKSSCFTTAAPPLSAV